MRTAIAFPSVWYQNSPHDQKSQFLLLRCIFKISPKVQVSKFLWDSMLSSSPSLGLWSVTFTVIQWDLNQCMRGEDKLGFTRAIFSCHFELFATLDQNFTNDPGFHVLVRWLGGTCSFQLAYILWQLLTSRLLNSVIRHKLQSSRSYF